VCVGCGGEGRGVAKDNLSSLSTRRHERQVTKTAKKCQVEEEDEDEEEEARQLERFLVFSKMPNDTDLLPEVFSPSQLVLSLSGYLIHPLMSFSFTFLIEFVSL